MIQKIRKEYASYSKPEIIFILCMMICSFAITAEAAITRSVSVSVFISAYSASFLPYVWAASVPLNFAIVAFYNHYLPSIGCIKMLGLSLVISTFINIVSAFLLSNLSLLPFMLYIWKDIFIILMFQQLWSVIHATINISRAKYLYGIFFGLGGIGSVVGSIIPGFLAVTLGSEKLLLTTIPFYAIIFLFYFIALRDRKEIPTAQNLSSISKKSTDALGGLKIIRASTLLKFILLLVLSMQIASTILDFQFSSMVETQFHIQDIRTQFFGRFFGMVNTVNIFLQFFGSLLLLQWIGLQNSHLLVPIFLAINSMFFLFFPTFPMVCFQFASIKAMDYSIFGIIKEMLYVPLKIDEKFKAKAIIDVFAYRTSKAIATFAILILQFVPIFSLNSLLSIAALSIFFIWLFGIIFLFKHYHKEVKNQHLNWPELIT